ncbi:MAG: phosphate signaling complex protein PhoU [Deltaproteobacteria bacterium]|jgi:phosphate transport system protein|nr:phosphate signaling complex protein PhoU [Deltaproteobacteria bacterium]
MPINTEKIGEIKIKLAEMVQAVVEIFHDSLTSIQNADRELSRDMEDRDDVIDNLEILLENKCLSLLALQAPKASELRYVVAVTRLTSDLERVGDHSSAITKSGTNHYLAPLIRSEPDFITMGEMALKMLKKATDSFFKEDVLVHRELLEEDMEVGNIQKRLTLSLVEKMRKEPDRSLSIVTLINIIRRVERVADHAKNIAALVPYVKDGTMARHERYVKKA